MHREDQFIPELIVRNGPAALDFYKNAFGAEEVHRMTQPASEKLVHGELIFGWTQVLRLRRISSE